MRALIALPILGSLLIIQSAVASQIPLLHGTPDLVLLAILAWALQEPVQSAWHWSIIGGLMMTVASALPVGAAIAGYLITTGLALVLKKHVWQIPILAMFIATIAGTVIFHAIALFSLRFLGDPISVTVALNQVTLPSILLNLVLGIPIFALLGDLAIWIHPEALEV